MIALKVRMVPMRWPTMSMKSSQDMCDQDRTLLPLPKETITNAPAMLSTEAGARVASKAEDAVYHILVEITERTRYRYWGGTTLSYDPLDQNPAPTVTPSRPRTGQFYPSGTRNLTAASGT